MLFAVLLAPLLVVDIPPLLDYPNHLARLFVIAHGAQDAHLSRFYETRWGVIPDLAIDILFPPLLRVLPVYVAGRVMLAFVLLLGVAGVAAYSRAVFGQVRAWALASVLVAYNVAFLLGFLNFLISLGLALGFAAAWIVWRERRPVASIAFGVAATSVLFFAHLMGVAFFCILVASSELEAVWRVWRGGGKAWRVFAVRAAMAAPLLIPPLVLYGFTKFHDTPALFEQSPWWMKAWQSVAGFIEYDFQLDMVSAALVYGGGALCLLLGRARFAPKSVFAFASLAVLFLMLPFGVKGTHWLDLRPAIMLTFLIFGGFTPVRLPWRAGSTFAAGLALLFVVRTATVAWVWHAHQADIDEYRAVIDRIPPGSRVFVVDVTQDEAPEYWRDGRPGRLMSVDRRLDFHIPAMILIERRAFWPGLFADPAQQPVIRRQPYDDLAQYFWTMPTHEQLVADPSLFAEFACRAGYILLTQAGADPHLAQFGAGTLDLVTANDTAALFRVRVGETPCPISSTDSRIHG